jgi:GTP pyrophosphokinase
MVVTTKAKSKIKDALKEEKRTIAEDGKAYTQRKLEGMALLSIKTILMSW